MIGMESSASPAPEELTPACPADAQTGADVNPVARTAVDGRSAGFSKRDRLTLASLAAMVALFFVVSPWPFYAKLHAIGRACCAQIPSHTLRFGDALMPIDARNTGIYLGVFTVIALLLVTGRCKAGLYVPMTVRNLLLGFVAAMVLDGFNSLQETQHLSGLYPDSNAMRVITGVLSGMALTILVMPLFNRIVWREPEVIAIADDCPELVGYLAAAVVVILFLLQAPDILFWPLSILSILGLLITLTMVNACILLVSFHKERTARGLEDLVIALTAGMVMTCGEIVLLDLWRIAAHR